MKKSWLIKILLLVFFALEAFFAERFYREIVPFPTEEFWFTTLNLFLRDALLLGTAALLYAVRKRIRDRVKRYFPVVVIGLGYLCFAVFMVNYLKLDWGFLTILSILAGLNNNILLCLLAAMCYHKWPNLGMKIFYFLVYIATCIIMLFDAIYFWTTSMHVESVLFRNLNYYSIKGVLETAKTPFLLAVAVAILMMLILFRVTKPTKKKPNFAWSLLCVSVFTLSLNFSYLSICGGQQLAIDQFGGLWSEAEIEPTRQNYRNAVAMPVNVNFVSKAIFDTDRIVKDPKKLEKKVLSSKDKEILAEMGIIPERQRIAPKAAQYDRVVLLILESVHRDFLHFYNKNIPAETTPFLDELLRKYPHLDRYYSSAIPTTEGLNSDFRSQVIFDRDNPEIANQSSIYRQLNDAGWRGIFLNASSGYYSNEFKQYPKQFGMKEYYAREYLEEKGYTGASGWGFHNDVMYKETLKLLEQGRNEKLFLATKTLDMHQPYPYYGLLWEDMPESVRDNKYVTVRGMYWVDHTLKEFFKEAEANGLMDDRTLFVITSDHNPHSGGEYKELVENSADTQSIAPIPLIFVSKNLKPLDDLKTSEYASSMDLSPTLLPLMGLETPKDFLGRDLLQPTDIPFALGYFGGKAYYFSEDLSFVDEMDNPYPPTPQEDSLTNFIVWDYARRH